MHDMRVKSVRSEQHWAISAGPPALTYIEQVGQEASLLLLLWLYIGLPGMRQ